MAGAEQVAVEIIMNRVRSVAGINIVAPVDDQAPPGEPHIQDRHQQAENAIPQPGTPFDK
jgi:hypothetical protein